MKDRKLRFGSEKGQSTVEYFILLAAVIIVFLIFVARGGFFERSMNNTLQGSMQWMDAHGKNIMRVP